MQTLARLIAVKLYLRFCENMGDNTRNQVHFKKGSPKTARPFFMRRLSVFSFLLPFDSQKSLNASAFLIRSATVGNRVSKGQ